MGTSLTGTKPKDTYDSLIKVGDNGPISGTAKTLSDGLGNDLPISVSTSNVGIGLSAPVGKLEVSLPLYTNEDTSSQQAIFGNGISSNGVRIGYNNTTNIGYINALKPGVAWSTLIIGGNSVRFTANGNERVRVTTDGLTFNGDTAAANALSDYEQGTFTVVATPAASGTITLSPSTARYTKIGRQVSIQFFVTVGGVSSPVGTAILFTGLPFTIANADAAAGAASAVWADSSASYVKTGLPSFFLPNQTQLYAPIDASTVAAGDEFFVNMTYTV